MRKIVFNKKKILSQKELFKEKERFHKEMARLPFEEKIKYYSGFKKLLKRLKNDILF